MYEVAFQDTILFTSVPGTLCRAGMNRPFRTDETPDWYESPLRRERKIEFTNGFAGFHDARTSR